MPAKGLDKLLRLCSIRLWLFRRFLLLCPLSSAMLPLLPLLLLLHGMPPSLTLPGTGGRGRLHSAPMPCCVLVAALRPAAA